ncbi:putative RNA-directed DNA polymerase from transposon X-element, partial [Toxocara canis]
LPCHNSTSPDGIPYIFLNKTAETISAPLCHLFCRSLPTGSVPAFWKKAIIRPIHKKGSKMKPQNYRPISLTCALSKVMEKLIAYRLKEYFSVNHLFSPLQYGFLNDRSTTAVLLRTLQNWLSHVDQGGCIDCIYFDFRKAFDSVSLPKLFFKLTSCGIRGSLFHWIRDFLSGRSQFVRV